MMELSNLDEAVRQSWRDGTLKDVYDSVIQAAWSHRTSVSISDPHHQLSEDDLDDLKEKGVEVEQTLSGYRLDITGVFM